MRFEVCQSIQQDIGTFFRFFSLHFYLVSPHAGRVYTMSQTYV